MTNATFSIANTFAGNTRITGGGNFVKMGAGNLTINSMQGLGGLINVQAGTLTIGASGAFTNSNSLLISGGTLNLAGWEQFNQVYMTSGAITGSSFLQAIGSFNFTDSGTVSAKLRNASASLIKSGAGTVELSATGNDYGGTTTINGGTLLVSGTVTATSSVNVAAAGTLQLGNGTTTGSINTAAAITDNGSLVISRSNAVVQGADFSSAAITGTGSFTQAGSGNTTLNALNTYSGNTTIASGTLSIATGNVTATAAQALGTGTVLDLGVAGTSSGMLLYTGAAGTVAKDIYALGNGSDTVQNGGSGLLTLSGTLTKNGTVLTLKGGTNGIAVTGTIAGSSANSDLIIDGGTTTLSTANSYNGPTFIINAATLNANAAGALPTSNGRTAVFIDQSGSGNSTLAFGTDQAIASLTGASTSAVNLGSHAITVGTTSGSTTFAGVISGTGGSLTKDGASTLVLTGTNGYTGSTIVSNGMLIIDGSTNVSSSVTVNSGGTLGGHGTINGLVTLASGGTLNPGNGGPGLLTMGSLTLQLGSTTAFEINGTFTRGVDFDAINVNTSGGLTLNGNFTISFTNGSALANTTINLFGYLGSHTGDFVSVASTGYYTGAWAHVGETFTLDSMGQSLVFDETSGSLVIGATPEPSTWALLTVALSVVLIFRRRSGRPPR